jgi:methylmalonyl-CoA/ethylmalonyl-CoA epimerase
MQLADFGVREIGQIAVPVANIDRAVDFYGGVLGLRLLFRAPPSLAFFDCAGIRLMLSGESGHVAPVDGEGVVIYYRVGDIDVAHKALSSKGASFVGEPHLIARMPDHELWMAFLKDPDGNVMGLMEERR